MIELDGAVTDRQVFEIWARMLETGNCPKRVTDEALMVLYSKSCYAVTSHGKKFVACHPGDLEDIAAEFTRHGEPYSFERLRLS